MEVMTKNDENSVDVKGWMEMAKNSKDPCITFMNLRARFRDFEDAETGLNVLRILLNRLEQTSGPRFERYLRDAAEMSLDIFQVEHVSIHCKTMFGSSSRRYASLHDYLMRVMWRCRATRTPFHHLVVNPLERLEESCATYRYDKYVDNEEDNTEEVRLGTSIFACQYILLSDRIPQVLSRRYVRTLLGHHLVRILSLESQVPETMKFVLKAWCRVVTHEHDRQEHTCVFDRSVPSLDGDAIRALGDVATLCPDKSTRDLARIRLESDLLGRLKPSRCSSLLRDLLLDAEEKIVPSLAAYFVDRARHFALSDFSWHTAWDVAMYVFHFFRIPHHTLKQHSRIQVRTS